MAAKSQRAPSQVVAAAVARGAIPQGRAEFYMARAADGHDISYLDRAWTPPADMRRAMARAGSAGGQLSASDPADPDGIYTRLYPAAEQFAAAGVAQVEHAPMTLGDAGGQLGHGPVITEHEHPHSNYDGGSHSHMHRHSGDGDHAPDSANHQHQESAAAASGPEADELYSQLFGGG